MEIQVIDTHEKKLNRVLPKGLSIEVTRLITLVVGENGRGKTAFLRLVNDSLVNQHYFDYWGISYLWNAVKKDGKLMKRLFPGIEKDKLKDKLKEKTDENVFGFLRIHDRNPLYPFCYQSPISKLLDSLPAYATDEVYDNLFKLRHKRRKSPGQRSVSSLEDFFKSVERFYVPDWDLMQLKYRSANEEDVMPYFLIRDTDADDSVFSWFKFRNWGRNPEFEVLSRTKGFRYSLLNFSDYGPDYDKKPLELFGSQRNEKDVAPENSQAVVLMDEPTLFMSYSNQKSSREAILRFSQKYPQMKFFIATNDASFIEHAAQMNCGVIDFDKEPINFSS